MKLLAPERTFGAIAKTIGLFFFSVLMVQAVDADAATTFKNMSANPSAPFYFPFLYWLAILALIFIAAISIAMNAYGLYRRKNPDVSPKKRKLFLLLAGALIVGCCVALEIYIESTRAYHKQFGEKFGWMSLGARVLVVGLLCGAFYGVYRRIVSYGDEKRGKVTTFLCAAVTVLFLGSQFLNDTGLCFIEGRYLSDREILDRQLYQGSWYFNNDTAQRDASVRARRLTWPNSSRVVGANSDWSIFERILRGFLWQFEYEILHFSDNGTGEKKFSRRRTTGIRACGGGGLSGPNEIISEQEYKEAIERNKEILGEEQDKPMAGQDLSGLTFVYANFSGGSFKGTILKNAAFKGCNLENADFSGADLSGASFKTLYRGASASDLSGADFSGAKIDGVTWNGAIYNCNTKFPAGFNPADNWLVPKDVSCAAKPSAGLNYSSEVLLSPPNRHYRLMKDGMPEFKELDIAGANFSGVKIGSFENTNLKNANFSHASGNSDFINSDLTGADFSNSRFMRPHYSRQGKLDPVLTGAKFRCAYMADFIGGVDFSDADLTGALFGNANTRVWPDWYKFNPIEKKVIFWDMGDVIKKFGHADYSGMDLTGCDLMYYDLSTTNLTNAVFKAANLETTRLVDANLTGANFDGARLSERTKFPEGFDVSKHRFVPTRRQNEVSSPWRASDGGLKKFAEHHSPPSLAIPDFPDWDFSRLNYTAAWLPGSNMQGAKMRFTNWSASNLEKTNLSNVDATGAIFYDTVLNDADLSGANLYGADLRRANLSGVKLDKAILTNSIYNHFTVWPEGFDEKQSGAYFSDLCESPWGGPCQKPKPGAQCRCPDQ